MENYKHPKMTIAEECDIIWEKCKNLGIDPE